jgi:methylenetetrahydrofolate dehydrogenase (NADP+)/methenyltetrahydrofolate cyclohydrolase
MQILDGKKINEEIAKHLKQQIAEKGISPKLVIVQVGDNSASNVYIKMKVNFAEKIGANAEALKFPNEITEQELISEIEKLNADNSVNGIIVQLPIPDNINLAKILNTITPQKDVDGLGQENLSKLIRGSDDGIVPATARGIVDLLLAHDIEIAGKDVVVVGKSVLVGKSTALHFLNNGATVSVLHSKTQNLADKTRQADILISATGVSGLITADHINADQVVVDVGISVDSNGNISGDVDNSVHEKKLVKAISPVPGGVGPMTVASLFQNLIDTYNK